MARRVGGSIWFPPEGDDSGFPICNVPSRYFWLCPDCSNSMTIHGWTANKVIVRPICQEKSVQVAHILPAVNSTLQGTHLLRE